MDVTLCHYSVLGLQPAASCADVRAAYKRLCLALHPDKQRTVVSDVGHSYDVSHFHRVVEAARCLQDPEQRALYDHSRLQQVVSTVGRVSSVIGFDELDLVARDEFGLGSYSHECRCGGMFELVAVPTNSVAEKQGERCRHVLVECDCCSLVVRVDDVPC